MVKTFCFGYVNEYICTEHSLRMQLCRKFFSVCAGNYSWLVFHWVLCLLAELSCMSCMIATTIHSLHNTVLDSFCISCVYLVSVSKCVCVCVCVCVCDILFQCIAQSLKMVCIVLRLPTLPNNCTTLKADDNVERKELVNCIHTPIRLPPSIVTLTVMYV